MPQDLKQSDNWAKAIREHLVNCSKLPKGDGWLTAKQIRQKFNLTENSFSKLTKNLKKTGSLEIFRGSQSRKEGDVPTNQTWYRIKN
jgi:DNA-binding IscR family transcriptional regulator